MQHHGKRRITLTGVMIATFQPPVGAPLKMTSGIY